MDNAATPTTLLYVTSSSGKFPDDLAENHTAGIYIFELDPVSGAMAEVGRTDAVASSQYLSLSADGRHLYATHFVPGRPEGRGGEVHAFAVDHKSGALRHLNHLPTRGDSPCYVAVDERGRYVLSANYVGTDGQGSACLFGVGDDGGLTEMLDYVQHEGSSVNRRRQSCSHPHMICTVPGSELVLVPDLGIDKVMIYRLQNRTLTPAVSASLPAQPGAGPRHLAFHPQQPYMYLINELNGTITSYRYTDELFQELEIVPTLPADFSGENTCADIHVHPSGRFLYGSNRGHNSIVVYAIDGETGALTFVGHHGTLGDWPRGFAIDPTGRFLIVANQRSHDLFTFYIDQQTGVLEPTGQKVEIPAPICIKTYVDRG